MTAKRFTFHHDVDGVDYIEDESNGVCLICDELMCSLLNELHEKNMILKDEAAYYKLMLMSLEEEAKRLSQIG